MKSSNFKKDDPLYYKFKLGELLLQAEKQGVKMEVETVGAFPKSVNVAFSNDIGERVVLPLY